MIYLDIMMLLFAAGYSFAGMLLFGDDYVRKSYYLICSVWFMVIFSL